MVKMTSRPSSPTSLLWAHQLKREHGFLLGRMQQIESTTQQQEERLKKAELAAAKTSSAEDLKALAEKVQGLADDREVAVRLNQVKQSVMEGFENVHAKNEAMAAQIANLAKDDVLRVEERRTAFEKEKTLLKRVGEVEVNLKGYELALDRVGKRVDGQAVEAIRGQLERLADQARREGEGLRRVEESLEVLERANDELRKASERLEREVAKVAERPADAGLTAAQASGGMAGVVGESESERRVESEHGEKLARQTRASKSHKWVGGGADRDIILQGPAKRRRVAAPPPKAMAKTKAPVNSPSAGRSPQMVKAKQVAKPQQAMKSQAASKLQTAVKKQQPAAKLAVVTRLQVPPKIQKMAKASTVAKPSSTAKAQPAAKPSRPSEAFLDGDAAKPILRAGKGWVEVAFTPSASEQDSQESNPASRPRGRPRKQPRQDTLEELGIDAQRLTRGGRQSLGQGNINVPPKRKILKRENEEVEEPVPKRRRGGAAKAASGAQDGGAMARMEDLDVFASPFSSPGEPAQRKTSKDALLAAVASQMTTQQDEPAPKRRRVIEQVDDISLLEQFV